MFKALIREIVALSHAMGIEFAEDMVERNLKILAALSRKQRHPCREMSWKKSVQRWTDWCMKWCAWEKNIK